MTIAVDGVPVRASSLAVVVEHLLQGWHAHAPDDDLHLVIGAGVDLDVPEAVTVHRVRQGRFGLADRLRAQNVFLPRLCRRVGADALLGCIPATTFAPLPCTRALFAHDLRYALRPEQFPVVARLQRRVSYAIGYRQADAIACNSERTRQDLLDLHPWLAHRRTGVVHLGADHVERWPTPAGDDRYAVAFGQWANKNVRLVLDGWRVLAGRGPVMPLVVCGIAEGHRRAIQADIDAAGLTSVVELRPWQEPNAFRATFSGASLVVFPSDFEGFGLPAVEAMYLGIPVVVSPDPALLEVCDGHASVMAGWDPEALADAADAALARAPGDLRAAADHAHRFTWTNSAAALRALLRVPTIGTATGGRAPAPPSATGVG
jgi:glycosyltransferase involved in cell wall biosynthesis